MDPLQKRLYNGTVKPLISLGTKAVYIIHWDHLGFGVSSQVENMTAYHGARHWVLPGDPNNWLLGIERKIWGLRDKPQLHKAWDDLQPGDFLYFYVTRPISGIVGTGRVLAKFIGKDPFWPDEVQARRVIYPLRFEMEITALLKPEEWATNALKVQQLGIGVMRITPVNPQKVSLLLEALKQVLGPPQPPPPPEGKRTHAQIQELLMEIGKMKGYVVEKEYPIDTERLDVVWKRVEKGVPFCAFEIQIGGEIYRALGKLKHAFDTWNSNIYLVTERKWDEKLGELLSGTFHEIRNRLKRIYLEDVEALTEALKKLREIEEKLGI